MFYILRSLTQTLSKCFRCHNYWDDTCDFKQNLSLLFFEVCLYLLKGFIQYLGDSPVCTVLHAHSKYVYYLSQTHTWMQYYVIRDLWKHIARILYLSNFCQNTRLCSSHRSSESSNFCTSVSHIIIACSLISSNHKIKYVVFVSCR